MSTSFTAVLLYESIPDARLAGLHIQLDVSKLTTNKIPLIYNYKYSNWDEYKDVWLVGRLNPNDMTAYKIIIIYALVLKQSIEKWYTKLVLSNGGTINWSSILNCQQLTYERISNLGRDMA
ncbi:unnamed protein product [Rotaria sp. Silwood1]|nr:unnamed protein product [Rotaria sp. Silwood1]